MNFGNATGWEFVEAKFGGLFLKAGGAEIAPGAEFFADGKNVEPAVVVIIDRFEALNFGGATESDLFFFAAVETDCDFAAGENRQIGAQIIIKIADGDNAAGDPVRDLLRNQFAAAFFFEEQRWS